MGNLAEETLKEEEQTAGMNEGVEVEEEVWEACSFPAGSVP
jgi:hypothetical protein